MFDVDTFVSDCVAIDDRDWHGAVKEVLSRALADRAALADALPPRRAEIVALHRSSELTVLKVVWAPGMTLGPHDHRMAAAIGIYTGGEDNTFFRRSRDGLAQSGGRALRPGDVCLLGDDVIHAVHNPTAEPAGAIHVYAGDFFATPRREWVGRPPTEQPYDVERVLALFAAANAGPAALDATP
jgi:predicted metal-dependent enzyme (double-stranded beta helix superfamily)